MSDNAGNTTMGTSSPAVNIDKTAATVTASTTATAIVVAGTDWYKDAVTFQWTASDPLLADGSAGSGAGASAPSSSTFGTTGAGQGATSTATDAAGNTATGHLSGVNVDASNPVVAISCPGSVVLGASVTAGWTASDTGSGLATANSGAVALDTDTVGTQTAVAPTASDNVGHTSAPASCEYRLRGSLRAYRPTQHDERLQGRPGDPAEVAADGRSRRPGARSRVRLGDGIRGQLLARHDGRPGRGSRSR